MLSEEGSVMDGLASWMRMERSEEVDRRTVEEGKKERERMVDRWGFPRRRRVDPGEVDVMKMEPSSWPVA